MMTFVPLRRMSEIAWCLTNSLVVPVVHRRLNCTLATLPKWRNRLLWKNYPRIQRWCSTSNSNVNVPDDVTVYYQRGLPVITVPLPSRREKCRFTLKPVTNTVGDFLEDIQKEDKGVDRVLIQSLSGTRIASSTSIATLMQENFHLTINNVVYTVEPPEIDALGSWTSEKLSNLSDVRSKVAQLYEALNVDQHQIEQEKKIICKLETIRLELEPLEKKKEEILRTAARRSTLVSWVGLAMMGAQFGILARLTWWEYSWDIMEPVTYFITYGTTIAIYAYFVLTRQEYILPDVCDRQTLNTFHKHATKRGLDVERYNILRTRMAILEEDLGRLRDPLQLHLPLKEVMPFHKKMLDDSANTS